MSQITIFSAPMTTLLLCSFSLYCANAGSFKVFINPTMVETGINEWANFSCSLRCDLKQTFNIKWAVGFTIPRGVQTDDTKVIQEGDNCASGAKSFGQTLRILVDSIDLDKTPVQCFALPKSNDGETIHYSSYSVLRVKATEISVPESDPDYKTTTQEEDQAVTECISPNTKQPTQQPATTGMALSAASTLSPTLLLTLLIGLAIMLCVNNII